MKNLLKLSVLSISMITVMAGAAVSPALANISNAFPGTSTNLIKMILTLPALFIIIFSLLSGKLTSMFSKKQILISGILIYIIGGVGPIFVDNLSFLLVCRGVLGVGCGLIMPISQSLITDFFSQDEKIKMTGYSSAASNLMGVISSVVVGGLSSINWKYGFYIYSIAVIVLLLNIIVLPKQESQKRQKQKSRLNKKVYLLAIEMCLITMAFYAVPTNIALFMKQEHIGNSSSAGLVIAVFTFSGFIAGMILSNLVQKFKQYTIPAEIGIMCLGYSLLLFSNNIFIILTAVALVGFSFSIIYPIIFLKTGNVSDKSSNSISMSIISSAMFLGQFLSPIVLQGVGNIFNESNIRFNFEILIICLSIALILSLIFQLISRRRYSKDILHNNCKENVDSQC